MYALVVCLDNIKRVIPADYIQHREEDGSIAVYIPDKQRFCNAVILEKGESKEILQEKLQPQDEGSPAASSKRKLETSSVPSYPPSKRLKESEQESRPKNTEQHVQMSATWTPSQNNCTPNVSPHPLSISCQEGDDNSQGLHSGVSLPRLLCELLQDQRALKRQVKDIENTLQQILETVKNTHAVVDEHQKLDASDEPLGDVKEELLDEQSEENFSRHATCRTLKQRSQTYPSMLYVENGEHSEGEPRTFEDPPMQNDLSVSVLSTARQCQHETQQLSNGQLHTEQIQKPLDFFPSSDMNNAGDTTVDLPSPASGEQQCRLVQNNFVVIPIKFDSTNASEEYIPPVLIRCIEYQNILLKSKTSTAFLRSLLKFFFSVETLKTHNFEGGEVNTKNGKAMRGQLNRRMVMSLLDQVELEFPGSTKGFENMKYIKKSINDKCNHI